MCTRWYEYVVYRGQKGLSFLSISWNNFRAALIFDAVEFGITRGERSKEWHTYYSNRTVRDVKWNGTESFKLATHGQLICSYQFSFADSAVFLWIWIYHKITFNTVVMWISFKKNTIFSLKQFNTFHKNNKTKKNLVLDSS